MAKKRLGMSHLAREAGFGTRIWSEWGYWAGRLYNLVVAVGIALIFILSIYRYVPISLSIGILAAYILYLFLRSYFVEKHKVSFYHPLIQLGRAQFFIFMLTLLMAWLGEPGVHGYLWLLYTLQLMIIGRHLNKWALAASILEVWLLLATLHWWVQPASSWLSLWQDPEFVIQCSWIALISFIIYYLLRNIDARDETIATLNQINTLAPVHSNGREADHHWEKILSTYMKHLGGQTASVWLYNQHTGQTRLLNKLTHCQGESCPLFESYNTGEGATLQPLQPVAKAVRRGRPIYCKVQVTSGNLLSRPVDSTQFYTLPAGVHSSMLVPIKEQIVDLQPVLGLLCVDFNRASPPREHLLTHYFEFLENLAQRIAPSLRVAGQMEEQYLLRRVGIKVSSSLRLEDVLNDTLDVLTVALGFELATISLVDEEAQLIRCVAGRNVSSEWIKQACHPLTSADIQADVVRRGQVEVISGWDERFDNRIYDRFSHHELVRAFVPIPQQNRINGKSSQAQGVVEVGYDLKARTHIPADQRAILTAFVDQAAVAIEKARLFEDTLRHQELLAQLHQVSHDIALARQPDEVLARLGAALQSVLDADIVMFYQYDRLRQKIEPPQIFGEVWSHRPIQLASIDRSIVAEILRQGKPYYAADAADDPLLTKPIIPLDQPENRVRRRTFTQRQNIKSFAGVPMLTNGETIGVLCINYRRRHAFGQNEQSILGLAAQLAAVALRNAEFNALSAELAVSEERGRLAGQLHDSVSQFLPAIQLMADTALKQLPTQPEQTAYWLERIRHAAHLTIAEIRINLFELSVSSTRSRNLRQALQESAALAREYFNLEVNISPQAIPEDLQIPIGAELLLICREAIVNASRHAQAQRIMVDLSEVNGKVRLQVQDDGRGFDVSTLSQQGMRGLKLMNQRVERMGGYLNIHSQPGHGTTIEVVVPTSTS